MKSLLLVSLITVSGACVDQLDDNNNDDVTEAPRLAVNGLAPSQIQYTTLDAAPLTPANVTGVASTSDGRAFLNYVVSCSLDATQTLTVGGVTYYGSVGLVPQWTTRSITIAERHWVTSCILARVNYIATSVQISMRGTHPALALAGAELTGYNKEEGAFYGDIFGGMSFVRACTDPASIDGSLTYNKGRRCATPAESGDISLCGFQLDGMCADRCTRVNGVYSNCTDLYGNVWNEPIKAQD